MSFEVFPYVLQFPFLSLFFLSFLPFSVRSCDMECLFEWAPLRLNKTAYWKLGSYLRLFITLHIKVGNAERYPTRASLKRNVGLFVEFVYSLLRLFSHLPFIAAYPKNWPRRKLRAFDDPVPSGEPPALAWLELFIIREQGGKFAPV